MQSNDSPEIPAPEFIVVSGLDLATTSATEVARAERDALLVRAAKGTSVKTAEGAQKATAILTDLLNFADRIEDAHAMAKAKPLELCRQIDALGHELKDQVKAEAERLDRIIGAWNVEQARLAKEERQRAFEKEQEIIREANELAAKKRKEEADAKAEIDRKANEAAAAAKKKADDEAAEIQRAADEQATAAKKRAADEQAELALRKANTPAAQKRLEEEKAAADKRAADEQERIRQEAADARAAADEKAAEEAEAARLKAEKEKTAVTLASAKASDAHSEKVENAIAINRVEAAGIVATRPTGTSTRQPIEFEITNILEVFEHSPALVNMTGNTAAIKNALKQLGEGQTLPGIRHWRSARAGVKRA